jgi:hypothetical protein
MKYLLINIYLKIGRILCHLLPASSTPILELPDLSSGPALIFGTAG